MFHRRTVRRAQAFLQNKASVRGRRCSCDPSLSTHLVHSEGLREGCDVVVDYASNVENSERL